MDTRPVAIVRGGELFRREPYTEGSVGPVRRAVVVSVVVQLGACTTMGDVLDEIEADGGGSGESSGGESSDGASSSGGAGAQSCGDGEVDWWCPSPGLTWQTQRAGPLDYAEVADIYALPLFMTDAATVDTLHGDDRAVICWFSAGISTWADPDRELVGPALGTIIGEGPEHWLDTEAAVVREAMLARLDAAVALGCDAVEPGDLDGWQIDSGWPLTRDTTIGYLEWLVENAHARGLAIALQDGPEIAADVEDEVDFAMDYGCLAAGTCDQLAGFTARGKTILHAELIAPELVTMVETYAIDVCAQSESLALVTIFKKPDLNAWRYPCD
jgi:hypothetical protein